MSKEIYLLFVLLALCLNLEEEDNTIIESITEGIKTYNIPVRTPFCFNAIDNGTYLFLFEKEIQIVETSGKTGEDMKPYMVYGLIIYAQNFTEGDFLKIVYPFTNSYTGKRNIKIKIEKIDGNFRLFYGKEMSYYQTIAVDSCQKPLYIFAKNDDLKYEYDQYTFSGLVHFGEFKASYKTSEINLNEILLNNLTDLPFYDINLIKLECINPGLITFLI